MTASTDVQDRDQWRARIQRALAELQTDAPHVDGRVSDESTRDDQSADL